MNRYHKKIYFPHTAELDCFNKVLNGLTWDYTLHCLENIKNKVHYKNEIEDILIYILQLDLDDKDIFEYYEESDKIIKACYRVSYTDERDLILVMSADKKIVTIYFNGVDDDHVTLDKSLYISRPTGI